MLVKIILFKILLIKLTAKLGKIDLL